MTTAKPNEVLDMIEKYWPFPYKKELLGTGVVIAIEWFSLSHIGASTNLCLAAGGVSVLALFLVFWRMRALPKTANGKVGFVVCVACSVESDAKTIREDFFLTLRKLLKDGKAGSTFQFIEIPNDVAEHVVDVDDAMVLLQKTKAHFVLFGRVRLREHDKKEHYFIDLNGVVRHKPIESRISQQLGIEFTELLLRQVAVPKDSEFLVFQFTSAWTEIVAKYIIGMAAAASGDLEYAEDLYRDSWRRIGNCETGFPVYSKLQERIPNRLLELFAAKGYFHYRRWTATHDEEQLCCLGECLERAREFDEYAPSLLSLNAIFYFLRDRDVSKATAYLERYPKSARDAGWHYNRAFLYAYVGNLKKAFQLYRAGFRLPLLEPAVFVRIPRKLDTHSNATWASIPNQTGPRVHVNLGQDSTPTLTVGA